MPDILQEIFRPSERPIRVIKRNGRYEINITVYRHKQNDF